MFCTRAFVYFATFSTFVVDKFSTPFPPFFSTVEFSTVEIVLMSWVIHRAGGIHNLSTFVVDKFSTFSTCWRWVDSYQLIVGTYPHFLWISFPHCPIFMCILHKSIHIFCHLSTFVVDKFSTLSTSNQTVFETVEEYFSGNSHNNLKNLWEASSTMWKNPQRGQCHASASQLSTKLVDKFSTAYENGG